CECSSYIGNTWHPFNSTTGTNQQCAIFDAFSHTATLTYLPYIQPVPYTTMPIVPHVVNVNATYMYRGQLSAQYLKNALSAIHPEYTWSYSPGSGPEDTSHANVDLAFVLEMYRNGQIFTGADMDKFTDALTEHMWNGSLTAPTVKHYVNGTGATDFTKYLSNWTELAQFDMRVFDIAAKQFQGFTPTNSVYLLNLTRIMKWDRSKIANQGFEMKTSFDATQPAQWNRIDSTSATAYLDSANKYEGSYGLTIKATGTTPQQVNQTWQWWQPSTSYTLSFMGKTDGTGAGGKVYVKNETTGTILASVSFTDTNWTAKSVTFTSPSNASHVVRTYITNNNATVTNGKA